MTEFELPARHLAAGWLNVSRAWSNDPEFPNLYRTVLVERHATGVRLVSTDSFLLLSAWVADEPGDDAAPPPEIGESPDEVWLVSDSDERCVGLAKWLLRVTKPPKGDPTLPVELAVVSLEDPDQPTLTPDMQREALAVRTPIERVSLPLVDQPAVDWRRVVFAHETKATRTLATTPAMCARLGQLVGVDQLQLHLAGSLGALRLEADGIVPLVGLFMPVRGEEDDG